MLKIKICLSASNQLLCDVIWCGYSHVSCSCTKNRKFLLVTWHDLQHIYVYTLYNCIHLPPSPLVSSVWDENILSFLSIEPTGVSDLELRKTVNIEKMKNFENK